MSVVEIEGFVWMIFLAIMLFSYSCCGNFKGLLVMGGSERLGEEFEFGFLLFILISFFMIISLFFSMFSSFFCLYHYLAYEIFGLMGLYASWFGTSMFTLYNRSIWSWYCLEL